MKMTMAWLKKETRRLLKDLGGDKNSIARALARKGIKGWTSIDSCPLAVYLKSKLPQEVSLVEVDHCGVINICLSDHVVTSVPASRAAKAFVKAFDDGDFPNLES